MEFINKFKATNKLKSIINGLTLVLLFILSIAAAAFIFKVILIIVLLGIFVLAVYKAVKFIKNKITGVKTFSKVKSKMHFNTKFNDIEEVGIDTESTGEVIDVEYK